MTLSTTPALDAFVIRNTFLELEDNEAALTASRCRSVSDYTDARRGRSWSICSAQDGWVNAFSGLEAVIEAESDPPVPDEDALSLTDSRSSALCAEMLAMLESDDNGVDQLTGDETRRTRARTSSTLFWLSHEATLPQGDEDESSPEQTEAAPSTQSSAFAQSDAAQGHTYRDAAEGFAHIRPQEVCMADLRGGSMGSFLAPVSPALPMPWYAFQSVQSTRSESQRLTKPNSSSTVGSTSELSQSDATSRDVNEEVESKLSKRKQRRGVRANVWQSTSSIEEAQSKPTTVMLRNLPNRYTRKMFLRLLDTHGFSRDYDFVYLPIDFRHRVNLGYAFVNMASHESAVRMKDTLDRFSAWTFDSQKVCEVVWAAPHQGLAPNIERYRNSPVMHESVSDEFKPILFKDGMRVAFPPPTKTIRAPKFREAGDHA